MSGQSLTRVLVERERLRARIDTQRHDIDRYVAGLEGPAAVIDRLRQAGRFVRSHPRVMAAAVAGAFVLRTRSMLGLAVRAAGVWRLARRAQTLLRHIVY